MNDTDNLKLKLKLQYAVILVDTNLETVGVCKSDLRYFDEYCDAELWIKTHGCLYACRKSDPRISRFFRIEKRYYLA